MTRKEEIMRKALQDITDIENQFPLIQEQEQVLLLSTCFVIAKLALREVEEG